MKAAFSNCTDIYHYISRDPSQHVTQKHCIKSTASTEHIQMRWQMQLRPLETQYHAFQINALLWIISQALALMCLNRTKTDI